MLATIKTYYRLTKPGIIYGNSLAAVAGFFLASKGHFSLGLFVAMLLGTALIIGSACVFNNYIDRGIDEKMVRTQKRPLVQGTVSGKSALLYGTVLGMIGFMLLALFTNWLTVAAGAIGIFSYVVVYGIAKRTSTLSTLIGSIPGAMPPVAGYVAVTNNIDMAAILLFLILVFWQMPHFYAIGVYRLKDYANAGLPILPVKDGIFTTQAHIIGYMIGFLVVSAMLSVLHYTGITYLIVMSAIGLIWLWMGVQGFRVEDKTKWGKKVFFFSLITLLFTCLLLSINVFLP